MGGYWSKTVPSPSIQIDPKLGYGYTTPPANIIAAFKAFTATVRKDLIARPADLEKFTFESPIEGFKQRKNPAGIETSKNWIMPLDTKNKVHQWMDDENFVIIRDWIFAQLNTACETHKVPAARTRIISINYYPPKSEFDPLNPVFPYHTDFGYINSLISDGPTMILDPVDGKWKEINLGDRMMFQVGGAMQAIDHTYKAIPHGVGRSPIIADDLGKISIVGINDPSGLMTLTKDPRRPGERTPCQLESMEYIRLRFKSTYEMDKLTEQERATFDDYLAQLDDFPRPTLENLALMDVSK